MKPYIPKTLILLLSLLGIVFTFSVQPVAAEPIPATANPNYFYNRETAFILNFAFDDVNGGIFLAVNPDGSQLGSLAGETIWGVDADLFAGNPMEGTDKSLYGHGTCIRYFISEYQRITTLQAAGVPALAQLNSAIAGVGGTPLASPDALLEAAKSCADFVINNMVINQVDDGIAEDPWNYLPAPAGGGGEPDIGDVVNPNRIYYWSATSDDATTRFVDDTLDQIVTNGGAARAESIVPWSMAELAVALQAAGVPGAATYRNHAVQWFNWRTSGPADPLPAFNDTTPPDDMYCPSPTGNTCIAGGARDTFYPALGYLLGGAFRTIAIAEANSILGTGDAPNLPFPREWALQDSTYVAGFARAAMFANHEGLGGAEAARDQWWDFGNNPANLIADFSNPGATPPLNDISLPFTHYSGRELLAGTQRALWFYYTYGENPNQAFPPVGTFSDSDEMLVGVISLWDYINEELWDTVDGQEAWFESSQHLYKPCFSAGTDLPIGDWLGPLIGDKVHTLNPDNSATVDVTGVTDESFDYMSWQFQGAGISDVEVVYTTNNGTTWTVIPATQVGGSNNYQATIPPQPDGTRVYYYARAQDAFQNNTAFPNGSEVWNDSGDTIDQSVANSQTYLVGEPDDDDNDDDNNDDGGQVIVTASDVTLSKVVFPPVASSGDTVDWTITLSNPTGSDVSNISITDTIPGELAILSADATIGTVTISGQNVTLNIATLPAGASAVLTIRTRINNNTPAVVVTNSVEDVSASLIIVSALPQTGETPWWHPCNLFGVCD